MADGYFDDEEDSQDPEAQKAQKNRENQIARLNREKEKLADELARVRTQVAEFQTLERERAATTAFADLGLGPKQAAAFVKLNPDAEVTREAAIAFATEYGWGVQVSETEAEQAAQTSQSFRPVTLGGVAPSQNRLTYEQYKALLAVDPAEALKAVGEGRVDGMQKTT